MPKKRLCIVAVAITILVIVTLSCGGGERQSATSDTTSSTKVPVKQEGTSTQVSKTATPQNTSTPLPTLTPTFTPMPTFTPTPLIPTWKQAWSIKTGNISNIGIAQDGTIYALIWEDQVKHVVISSNGEVGKITDVSSTGYSCVGDFYKFAGTRPNFYITPQGILICFSPVHQDVAIDPNGKIWSIETNDLLQIDTVARLAIAPDGQSFYIFIGGIFDTPEPSKLYNVSIEGNLLRQIEFPARTDIYGWGYGTPGYITDKVVFYNTKFEIVYQGIPNKMDLKQKNEYYLTPWGDLYWFYKTYDTLGNKTGSYIARIDQSGKVEYLNETPFANIDPDNVIYFPNTDKIYYLGDSILMLNHNFEIVEQYDYPPHISASSNIYIGYDGALYHWSSKTLSKYVLSVPTK